MLEEEKISLASEKKELLSERIHDEILELIIKNAADEEMVLNEKRLMELFGVSKAPIREALIKFVQRGGAAQYPAIWVCGGQASGKGCQRSDADASAPGAGGAAGRV